MRDTHARWLFSGLIVLALVVGTAVAGQRPRPHRAPSLDRHIHGTPADYNGRIVAICESRPREYCTEDGATCHLDADVYVSDVPCPVIRIK